MQDKDELFDYISNTKKSEITLESINYFICNGSNVNWTTNYGDDSLQVAVIRGLDAAIIKKLIDSGADVNSKDIYGYTPLMKAVMYDSNYSVIKFLLDRGAEINAQNDLGFTASLIAMKFRNFDALLLLKNHGADLSIKNNIGQDCASIAKSFYKTTSDSKTLSMLALLGYYYSELTKDNEKERENENGIKDGLLFGQEGRFFEESVNKEHIEESCKEWDEMFEKKREEWNKKHGIISEEYGEYFTGILYPSGMADDDEDEDDEDDEDL